MGRYEIKGEGRRFVALLVSIAVLQTVAYYLTAAFVARGGSLPAPQSDTLLYCQAARRIVEGHAFSYSAGTAVSTGTTSVIYPFVLAGLYALGMTGERLLTAGFMVNGLCFVIYLLGWGGAFRRWLDEKTALYATALLALSPMPAYAAFAQSDTGLWMACSALIAWGLASRRTWLLLPAMLIGPWIRPEAVLVAIACFLVFIWRRDWRGLAVPVLAFLSVLGIALLNGHLTGHMGFSSVSNKGFFAVCSFPHAVFLAGTHFLAMIREVLLGLSASLPRCLYAVPLLGGLAFACGIVVFDWRKSISAVLPLGLSAVAAVGLVAQSGWQGSNMDRYMAWIMPLPILLGAVGWQWLSTRCRSAQVGRCLLALPVVYSAVGIVLLCADYALACEDMRQFTEFAHEIDRTTFDGASIGSARKSSLAYFLGDRRVANLGGVYSPEFSATHPYGMLEILKNEPETRFDYWLFEADDPVPACVRGLFADTELQGPQACELRKTSWRAFDRAAIPPTVTNAALKCRVDICYEKDERASRFEMEQYYGMRPFDPIVEVNDQLGESAIDCGRIILGESSMNVTGLEPGRDVWVVIRTAGSAALRGKDSFGDVFRSACSFDKLGLHLAVDGKEVSCCHAQVGEKGFCDILLKLPGRFVTASEHRIGIHGDHVAFSYWFYQ